MGAHRQLFIAESLVDLDANLRRLPISDANGSPPIRPPTGLIIADGKPEEVLPQLFDGAPDGSKFVLVFQKEDTWEEQQVERDVMAALSHMDVLVRSHHDHTLLHREDLDWTPETQLPLPFGKFFHETAKVAKIRVPAPAPKQIPPGLQNTESNFRTGPQPGMMTYSWHA